MAADKECWLFHLATLLEGRQREVINAHGQHGKGGYSVRLPLISLLWQQERFMAAMDLSLAL